MSGFRKNEGLNFESFSPYYDLVQVRGDILFDSGEFSNPILRSTDESNALVIDLEGVEHADSRFPAALIYMVRERKYERPIFVCKANSEVRKVYEVFTERLKENDKFRKLIKFYDTLEEAVFRYK